MIYYPRCRKLAACAQFKIQNSKFSPCPTRLTCPTCLTRPTIAGAARTPSPLSLLIPPTYLNS